MSLVVGIDLGTSNTAVGALRDGKPTIALDAHGRNIFPSFVALGETGNYLCGFLARAQAVLNPYETVYAVKRLMGQRFGSLEVQTARKYLTYPIVETEDDRARVQLKDRVLLPEEVSAEILKHAKAAAEQYFGEEIAQAVITVPAHFNDGQRKATKRAGEMAGLDVLRLINEPTAAALAYGFGRNVTQRVAVYDFGGGTFDITILSIGNQVYEVLSTNGDSYLGGEDFTNRLVDWACDEWYTQTGWDLRRDRASLQRVKEVAEAAKIAVSDVPEIVMRYNDVEPGQDPGGQLDLLLARPRLEMLCADLVDRSLDICQVALDLSRLSVDDLDEVILVGGQTRMPFVQSKVQEFFRREPNRSVNPDEVVALGAAIQAEALLTQGGNVLLLDVTPLTLGIASFGDVFTPLLERNAKVPRKVSRVFTTSSDYQERVRITVLQGESRRASENTLLAEFILENIRRAPRMEPRIQVTFRIDANGILEVRARDLDSGEEQVVEIRDYARKAADQAAQMGNELEQSPFGRPADAAAPAASPSTDAIPLESDGAHGSSTLGER